MFDTVLERVVRKSHLAYRIHNYAFDVKDRQAWSCYSEFHGQCD